MSNFDHIILNIMMFLSIYCLACYVPKAKHIKGYLLTILVPLFVFSIVEGCRYGRGADHLWYCERYVYYKSMIQDQLQPVFWNYEDILHKLNFNVVHYMILNAAIFFLGVCFFIRNTFKSQIGQWMYLFAFCAMLLKFETFVRQYLALPVLLIGISFFMKGKTVKNSVLTGACIILSLSIHSGLIFCILWIIGFYFFVKVPFKPIYAIVTLFLAYYIIPTGSFANTLSDFFQNITLFKSLFFNENLFSYLDSSNAKSFAGSILVAAEQSFLTKTMQFAFECAVIVGGYKALNVRKNQVVLAFYNISIIAFVLSRLFHGYEMFARLFDQLYIFWFVPVGYLIYIYKSNTKIEKNGIHYSVLLISSYWLLYWGRWIFLNPEADYFWYHSINF